MGYCWPITISINYYDVTVFLYRHYRNAAGALVVFDVTNRNSFNDVPRWINDVRERSNENVVIGLIGNKIDLDRRAVSREEG